MTNCKKCGKECYFKIDVIYEWDWSVATDELRKKVREEDKKHEIEESKNALCLDCLDKQNHARKIAGIK